MESIMSSLHPGQVENLSYKNVARRHFLSDCGLGLGKVALAGLLTGSLQSLARSAAETDPLAPRKPHFPGKAKAVIHLFMAGAPSQLELFDSKPELTRMEGKPIPPSVYGDQRYAFIQPDAAVLGPRYKFARHGESGAELSEMLPHLAKVADDVCIIRSMHTDQFNHAPAQIFLNTGFAQPGRPSFGSWVLYGLGCETQNLPAFVVMSTGSGISGGSANWSSGFLPTVYSGVRFRNQGDPILNVSSPPGVDTQLQRDSLDLVQKFNRNRLELVGDPEIETRIAAYEMAFRLQTSAPELTDLSSETQATLDLYGCEPEKPSFARACLLARRMVERGVRFINIYHEGWDAHSDVAGNVKRNCAATDQGSAALIADLKERGLLDETLVIWGGEFGRTPMVESSQALGRSLGRDHHPQAFSMWLAGGGIKPGLTHGATDELGFHVAEDPVHIYDLQATLLHMLGFDHERLTFPHAGRDFRLTDVHGQVIQDLLA
ncbi:MAG: DUF1501 domain-containing protein [Planctomycetota bacterium]|nr:MAG: DUF1501 domain-containing protein [Planctomycetota bacterium]REK36589.1 MAG: DUF1501 domain-containing protein [Planctomycetota bacterium]